MANEFRHESTAAGTSCSQADWEDTDIHRFQGQAQGDIAYASTNTQISRLAIGSTGQVLEISGGLPSWQAKGFSSKARAYTTTDQHLPHSTACRLFLDTEDYDVDGEFNNRALTGAADATEANKLHDADGGFEAGDVGAVIWNTTDDTYTTVTGFVDNGELDLNDDIMVNGEGYKLYHATFTATSAGYYLIIVGGKLASPVANKMFAIYVEVNGATSGQTIYHSADTGALITKYSDVLYLDAADYVYALLYHGCGVVETVAGNIYATHMTIHRIS